MLELFLPVILMTHFQREELLRLMAGLDKEDSGERI
jgi:hypothetical protein